ncbi:MAG: hypothetical protein R2911_21425 [Caldilineaceae bacterium]
MSTPTMEKEGMPVTTEELMEEEHTWMEEMEMAGSQLVEPSKSWWPRAMCAG